MSSTSPRSTLVIKNVKIDGRRTSVKLEPTELEALNEICFRENLSIHEFCRRADINPRRREASRTGRIRMAILDYYLRHATFLAATAISNTTLRRSGHTGGVE